ncbi:MAG: type II secretion system protein [Sedimentisphaerales bacterium]|nr:type II secretion system protein [Sedimentisphaerales bacterium]
MTNLKKNHQNSGWILTETIVALAVILLLVTALLTSLREFGRFNHYQLVRYRCVNAAQAQLDSIAATGSALTSDQIQKLWPDIDITINKSPGSGCWQGFTLVTAHAHSTAIGRNIQIELSKYLKE